MRGWLACRRSIPTTTVSASRRLRPNYGGRSRRQTRCCFCTPEYAGSLPGSFKNLLDWTVGGGEMYGKPVAWINVAAECRGMGAPDALASVLGYLGATVIETACRRIPVARTAIGPD